MKNTKLIPTVGLVALVLVALRPLPSLSAGGASGMMSVDDLAAKCRAVVGPDGFGSVDLQGQVVVANSRGTIETPCRIYLQAGASLTFANTQATSAHLVIRDGDEGASNSVSFHRSQMTGGGDSGLLVDLHDSADSVAVTNSVLDYSASLWIRSLGSRSGDLGGGRLMATSSVFRSLGPESEGVEFLSGTVNGGQTILTDVSVATSGPALAVGDHCVRALVAGLAFDCGSVRP